MDALLCKCINEKVIGHLRHQWDSGLQRSPLSSRGFIEGMGVLLQLVLGGLGEAAD